MTSSEGFVDNPWEQNEDGQCFLKKIHPRSILRTFIPSEVPLIDDIMINYKPLIISLNNEAGLSPQEEYIFKLVSAILKSSEETFDEQHLLNEINFLFKPNTLIWNEARSQWNKDELKTTSEKIQLMKALLYHDWINWNVLAEISDLPNLNFDDFVNIYYSACSIPWLDVLRLATFDCYGHAELYSRSLYPEIYSIPFIHKKIGFRLEINYDNKDSYIVTQARQFAIYLRRQPSNPDCTIESGEPLAYITFLWSVCPRNEPFTYRTSFMGNLSLKSVEFTSRATLDEREIIHSSLLKKENHKPFVCSSSTP